MRNRTNCAIGAALAATIALTSFSVTPAAAAPSSKPAEVTKYDGSLEVSDRRRHRRYRGNAAVLGAVATVFGSIAALAAADAYRDRYYRPYYGYYGPRPYYYYGHAPYPYRYRYWHRGW
jgi:hypothetical protein